MRGGNKVPPRGRVVENSDVFRTQRTKEVIFNHTGALIEGRAPRIEIESTEYSSNLQLLLLDLLLVIPGVGSVCPPPESPLDFACEPKVVQYDGQRLGVGLINTPF